MLVLALYTISGAAGLVLESVFLRQIALLVGSTATATSLVLAAFLGGLAAGSATVGRLVDRVANPLRLYALLEIGAGASGVFVVALLGPWREALEALLRAVGPGAGGRVAEGTLAFALLALPAALLGGTFPALARLRIRDAERLAGPAGLLYGLNTLGGAIGAFAAGFWLFESLGIARSGFVAATADVAIGVAAAALSRSPRATVPLAAPFARLVRADPLRSRACFAAATIAGGAMLGFEVVWTRLLTLPMRSFVYSFSLMLSLFLLGLVVGALLLSAVASRVRDPMRALGVLLVAAGAYVASSVTWLPALLAPPEGGGFGGLLVFGTLRAAVVVLPPTILSGMAMPLAMRGAAPPHGEVGRIVGSVYAANTLGCIAGALLAGLVLLPALGAPRSLVVLSLAMSAAGAIVLVALRPSSRSLRAIAVSALLACAALLAWPTGRFVEAFLRASRGRESIGTLLFFHEGATDTVAVVTKEYGFRDPRAKSLLTNGIAMSATVTPVRRYMAAEGHLPVLFAPEPRRALAVGVGTGITLAAVVSHPSIERVDAVELSEGVLRALRSFDAENDRADLDPRVRVVRDDGRRFLSRTTERYDLVTAEPPPPIVAGSSSLYSLEFYRLVRRSLNPGGVMVQWLPLHAQSLASARMTARTFLAAFPHAQLWLPSVRDAVLLGSERPLRLDLARLDAAYAESRTASNLRAAYLETPEAFLATFLLDREGIDRWTGLGEILTDERPRMEFFRSHGSNFDDRDLATLLEQPRADLAWASGLDEARAIRIETERQALRLYVRGQARESAADGLEAARISRGTDFFLHRLGCAPAQLDAISTGRFGAGAEVEGHLARCRALTAGVH